MFEEMYKDDDIVLLIEWDEGLPYIHHHFYNWSVSIHKRTLAEFDKIVTKLRENGYNELWSYYDKENVHVDKFCKRYGFEKVSETITQNIVLKEI
jgi:hypothetical protein